MKTARMIMAAVALAGLMLIPAAWPASASPARHAEPSICGPIVALIVYWLPVTDRATPQAIPDAPPAGQTRPPKYPWADAATELFDVDQFAPEALSLDTGSVANSIGALGAAQPASVWHPILRKALQRIRAWCPSLPASVATGRLPA
jgi:hypothetical protein